jgi:hypothetical protein
MSLSQTTYSKYSLIIDDNEIDQEIVKQIKLYENYNRSKFELKKCEFLVENLNKDKNEFKKLQNLIAKHRSDSGNYLAQLNRELALGEINNNELKDELHNFLCKLCSCSFNNIRHYFEHLNSNFHYAKMELADDHKISKICDDDLNLNEISLKGYQFIQPCKSYFCTLCNQLFSDAYLCELHLKSGLHHEKLDALKEKL